MTVKETYKGRKLVIREEKGRNKGWHGCYVNGQLVVMSARDSFSLIEQLRRDVDAVDERPSAYPDYWLPAK